jgi:hypothetical protein
MLMKHAQVDPDGTYHPPPVSKAAYGTMAGRCRLTLSNPFLKAPGSKRLKLRYCEPLSKYTVEFNLRRYTMVFVRSDIVMSSALYMKKAVTIAIRQVPKVVLRVEI